MSELDDYAAKMAARFHTFDQDGDGRITRRDFRLMAEQVARAFGIADGTVPAVALHEAADRYWEGMAALADDDVDGRITRGEFVGAALAGLHQDPEAVTRIVLPWHRAVFRAADHDGDRRVTVNAVDLMLVALGGEPDQARRVSAEHRTDPTGLITEDEILAAVTAYYTTGEPQRAFAVPA
ncbi:MULTISPECIES: EF-hand domain-containing protein [unclassified Streptomyces]|uniref:EF-hand domain-containing protein n=1 Tax=unclassified Streptomyces TaxID=2593676 RepID=UPI0036528427